MSSDEKAEICPNCKGTNVSEIMYGLPSQEFMEELGKEENKGKYVLGGCCVSDNDPKYSCTDCNFVFGHREDYDND